MQGRRSHDRQGLASCLCSGRVTASRADTGDGARGIGGIVGSTAQQVMPRCGAAQQGAGCKFNMRSAVGVPITCQAGITNRRKGLVQQCVAQLSGSKQECWLQTPLA
jgi:hypothetical protein